MSKCQNTPDCLNEVACATDELGNPECGMPRAADEMDKPGFDIPHHMVEDAVLTAVLAGVAIGEGGGSPRRIAGAILRSLYIRARHEEDLWLYLEPAPEDA